MFNKIIPLCQQLNGFHRLIGNIISQTAFQIIMELLKDHLFSCFIPVKDDICPKFGFIKGIFGNNCIIIIKMLLKKICDEIFQRGFILSIRNGFEVYTEITVGREHEHLGLQESLLTAVFFLMSGNKIIVKVFRFFLDRFYC